MPILQEEEGAPVTISAADIMTTPAITVSLDSGVA
jgi:hypothetical protein